MPLTGIDNKTLKTLRQQKVPLIDIRREDEWRWTGIIDGSLLLTAFDAEGALIPEFCTALAAIVHTGEPYILICRSGHRTGILGNMLLHHDGGHNVFHLQEGLLGWLRAGEPVVPVPCHCPLTRP